MISTRLDEEALNKLAFITETAHCKNRSDAMKMAIDMAFDTLMNKKKNWKRALLNSGFIASGESEFKNTSVDYKKILGEELDDKWSS